MEICNRMWFHGEKMKDVTIMDGEKMKDVTIVENILYSMMSKFDYVICAIKESKDIDELSFDEFQSSLLVHE